MRYRFITIEGNIGAGKTTLSRMLAEECSARLILETFSDNPFLTKFYEDPDKHAFAVELFFMAERYKQIQEMVKEQDLFHSKYISDYSFFKSLIFASVTLDEEERKLFNRLFYIINRKLPKPDVVIYLHHEVDVLLENIRERGRPYEQNIKTSYLKQLEEKYFQYLKNIENTVVLIIDMKKLNFTEKEEDLIKIREILKKEYKVGKNYLIW